MFVQYLNYVSRDCWYQVTDGVLDLHIYYEWTSQMQNIRFLEIY